MFATLLTSKFSGRLLQRSFVVLLVWSLALAHHASGQAVFGSILGTVSDPSGAAVSNITVIVTDIDRGTEYKAVTNADGNYAQTHLLAGRYKVQVAASGFSPYQATAEVQVDAATRVDIPLRVATAETTVEVVGESALLKTDRADVSTTLATRELQQLPVLNRNLTSLLLDIPGTKMNDWQHASSENPQSGLQIAANGQQFTANGFLLDGTENNSSILGIAVINPNIDSLQEFKVTTSNYDAEFGSVSGALMQATTKSGTNSIHGSAFEYLRNDVFNAADPFTKLNPPFKWNQFGGSLGGPIKKDKVFFFVDYQGTRRRTGASIITSVPTDAERAGDLRSLLGDYICADGSTSSTGCASPYMVQTTEGATVPAQVGMAFDPRTGDSSGSGRRAFSTGGQVNVIPVAAPIANLLKSLPPPNTGTPGQIFNNYIGSGSERFDNDQGDVRIDYTMSEKMHFFGRYTISDFDKHAPGAFGELAGGPAFPGLNFAGQSLARNQSLALGYSYTFSPTLITDARFGAYRYRVRVQPNGVGQTPASDAGLPGLNLGTIETSGMPAFYVNGDGGFQFGYSLGINQCNCPLKETENHFQWVNNWTKLSGNHAFRWGVDVRRAQQQRIPSDSHRSGEIYFSDSLTGSADVDAVAAASGVTSGSAVASFLLGQSSFLARYFTGIGFHPGLRQTRLFLYAQDSWRATSRLTLNYGLRYENYRPQTAASPGGAGSFDPNTGEVLAAGIGSVTSNMGVKPYNKGFAWRLGLAYQLRPQTVVRAGYGRSFTPSGLGAVFGQAPDYDPPITNPQSISQANPYVPAVNLLTGPALPVNPPIGSNGRYPLPDGIGVYYFFDPPNSFRIPLADSWNLSVQHEFTPTFSTEAAYIGNVGRHLYVNPNVNQAVPGPGDFNPRRPFFQKFGLSQGLYKICNCDNSNYNALQLKAQKRARRGLDFLVSYTWSKSLDNTEYGGVYDNAYDFRADHGPSNFDRTHAVTLAYVYELPYGHGRRWGADVSRAVDLVLGGWVFDGTSNLLSGLPFTPYVANAPLLNADFGHVRPDLVGDPSVAHQNADSWFNPSAFTAPQQPFRDGNVRRNSLRGPAEYLFNLALAKNFTIREGKTLEFRWENFNAFNHVNLGLPNNYVDVSGAGQITYTQTAMRQMQFGLHYRF